MARRLPPQHDGRRKSRVLPAAFPNLWRTAQKALRGRHGDVYPAAQCRRAVRCGAASDREAGRGKAVAAQISAGSGLSDGGPCSSDRAPSRRGLRHRARLVRVRARWTRRGHPVTWIAVITEIPGWGRKVRACRAHRGIDQRDEAAAGRRRAR